MPGSLHNGWLNLAIAHISECKFAVDRKKVYECGPKDWALYILRSSLIKRGNSMSVLLIYY